MLVHDRQEPASPRRSMPLLFGTAALFATRQAAAQAHEPAPSLASSVAARRATERHTNAPATRAWLVRSNYFERRAYAGISYNL